MINAGRPLVMALAVTASTFGAMHVARAATTRDVATPEATAQAPAPEARGPLFSPEGPGSGRFRLALGLLYDALDPYATAGVHLRVPQITLDARFDPGAGFALLAHLNTILASNQAELGVGWTARGGRWSGQIRLFGGALVGELNRFGFEAFTVTPLVRPGIVGGVSIGDHRVSLAVDMLLTSEQIVTLGTSTVNVHSAPTFTGMTATATAEVMLRGGGVVFYGAALMWTRANYQAWLLFSEEPNLLAYPRIFAGYGF